MPNVNRLFSTLGMIFFIFLIKLNVDLENNFMKIPAPTSFLSIGVGNFVGEEIMRSVDRIFTYKAGTI